MYGIDDLVLTFDVMDVSGEQQNNIDHDIIKTRLDAMGQPVYAIKEGIICMFKYRYG